MVVKAYNNACKPSCQSASFRVCESPARPATPPTICTAPDPTVSYTPLPMNMEPDALVVLAQPDVLQTQCVSTGYTQIVKNRAYKPYATNFTRSATAPDTMVAVEIANCREQQDVNSADGALPS